MDGTHRAVRNRDAAGLWFVGEAKGGDHARRVFAACWQEAECRGDRPIVASHLSQINL